MKIKSIQIDKDKETSKHYANCLTFRSIFGISINDLSICHLVYYTPLSILISNRQRCCIILSIMWQIVAHFTCACIVVCVPVVTKLGSLIRLPEVCAQHETISEKQNVKCRSNHPKGKIVFLGNGFIVSFCIVHLYPSDCLHNFIFVSGHTFQTRQTELQPYTFTTSEHARTQVNIKGLLIFEILFLNSPHQV